MRVLVTGHHGYIGAVVAPQLAEAGHDVVGLDAFLYRGCDFGPEVGRVEERQGDVRDVTAAELAGFDAVVHLAALSNDPLGDLNPEWTYDVNLDGTLRLARAAREAGVGRFVFSSSCSMYGASGRDDVLDEDAPLKPLTAYAESKVRAEEGLSELADSGFSPVSLRNATAYGASPRLRLDVVLNNLVGWAFTTGRIRLLSDGSSWRPIVHVRDVGRAILGVLTAPRALVHNQAYNVGATAENYRIRDLAGLVHEVLPECDVEFAEGASTDPRSYRVDFGRFEAAFPEHRAEWTAREGTRELADAYRDVGLTWEEFDGARYTRLKRLRALLDEGKLDGSLRRREAA
ncbi:MAG TPA: SDR family oxidoreductase [Gaiellaceae bacterium]|jgi:nucleoside-diphosphate-sugar epimerase|nr:SDR family oxidoreductase [Gaiellaceae bacterium]